MGIVESTIIFGVFSVLTWVAVSRGIPLLHHLFDLPLIVGWYLTGTLVVLVPMLVFAVLMARRELVSPDTEGLKQRLWLRRIDRIDVVWGTGGQHLRARAESLKR